MVYEIVKVDTARTPHLLTTRLLGMWNDGVVQPLQRPGGKKFPSADMSFLLSGDELRIGYTEESRRQLKQQELYEPFSKKVAIYVLRRVTRGQ